MLERKKKERKAGQLRIWKLNNETWRSTSLHENFYESRLMNSVGSIPARADGPTRSRLLLNIAHPTRRFSRVFNNCTTSQTLAQHARLICVYFISPRWIANSYKYRLTFPNLYSHSEIFISRSSVIKKSLLTSWLSAVKHVVLTFFSNSSARFTMSNAISFAILRPMTIENRNENEKWNGMLFDIKPACVCVFSLTATPIL